MDYLRKKMDNLVISISLISFFFEIMSEANDIIDQIIYREENETERLKLTRGINDVNLLRQLVEGYNWDDGIAIPLEIVKHPCCDLGLALLLFWEYDIARMYYLDPLSIINEYDSEEEKKNKISFCEILISGIRNSTYKAGDTKYDTGFFGEGLYSGDERKRKIRDIKTRKARELYEEVFMKPVF